MVGALLKPLALVPPVTSTVPSASSVALSLTPRYGHRARMVPHAGAQQVDHLGVAVGDPPPTTRIFPTSYITAEP